MDVAGIEVKRARVRALAWRLISNPPRDFDLENCTKCAIATACGMPEFELIGWSLVAETEWYGGIEKYPRIQGRRGHSAVRRGAKLLGLKRWHVGFGKDADEFIYAPAFHVGVTYLEAIGDCGPPERARVAVTERAGEMA